MSNRFSLDARLHASFALVTGVYALVATFSRIDDTVVGQRVWGIFLVSLSVIHTTLLGRARWPKGWWPWWLGHAGSALVIGIITLALASRGAVGMLMWSIAVWAVLAGASYFLHGVRLPADSESRSDWRVLGALTMLLGLATLVEPVDPVWLMGSAGAWAAIASVFSAISALHVVTGRAVEQRKERVGNG